MKQLEEIVRERMLQWGAHGLDHTLRVRGLALTLAEKEHADKEIVEAAAMLHDIARAKEDKNKGVCHAEQGAIEAEKVLSKLDFPKEAIAKVQYCITVHRVSKGLKAETPEAKILQDADRLDVLGAIGIGRVFAPTPPMYRYSS